MVKGFLGFQGFRDFRVRSLGAQAAVQETTSSKEKKTMYLRFWGPWNASQEKSPAATEGFLNPKPLNLQTLIP